MIFQRNTFKAAFANRNKYGNKKVEHEGGRSFGSQFEAALFSQLSLLEKAGELRNIQCQVHVRLLGREPDVVYIPDFSAEDRRLNWETVYFEAKGYETPEWRIKRRLWHHFGPGRLRVFKGSAKSFKMVEEIVPHM